MASFKAAPGNIHRIREFELEKVNLAEEFDILQIVGEGWFGKILLVEHRATDTEMVLKALPKPYVSLRDFFREFHYGLHLGQHRNVITTYDVAFETAGFYVFSQEYAPLGDLTSNISESGIGELHSKRVARQLAAALDHLHAKELVHRDVKLDNVLVFKSDFSRVKLCDFGETRKSGSVVRRRNEWLPYSPPEVLQTAYDDTYKADTSHDVWQFGIVVFVCLTGCLPWQKAAPDDPRYVRFNTWHTSSMGLIRRQPKLFRLVTSRAQRMFRRFLEPRQQRRPLGLGDLHKYMEDRWLAKGGLEKNISGYETDELCPSMYSFHSSLEDKNKLLHTLTHYGIETTVDRTAKKDRIKEWIQTSVICEEDETEEEDNDSAGHSSQTNIVGHFPATMKQIEEKSQRISTLRDSENKHINPRTGEVLQHKTDTDQHKPTKKPHSNPDSGYGSTDLKNTVSTSPYLNRRQILKSNSTPNATLDTNMASHNNNHKNLPYNGSHNTHNSNPAGSTKLTKMKESSSFNAHTTIKKTTSSPSSLPFPNKSSEHLSDCVESTRNSPSRTIDDNVYRNGIVSSPSRTIDDNVYRNGIVSSPNESPHGSRELQSSGKGDESTQQKKESVPTAKYTNSMKDTPYDTFNSTNVKVK